MCGAVGRWQQVTGITTLLRSKNPFRIDCRFFAVTRRRVARRYSYRLDESYEQKFIESDPHIGDAPVHGERRGTSRMRALDQALRRPDQATGPTRCGVRSSAA